MAMKILAAVTFALALLASASTARAAQPAAGGSWRVTLNLASVHTAAWARRSLNQINPGAGITYAASRTWALAVGEYKNSYSRTSAYALAKWTPLHIGQADRWHVDAGLAGGLLTGYSRAENPARPFGAGGLIRFAAPSGAALELLAVPNTTRGGSGFIGFQLSFPLN